MDALVALTVLATTLILALQTADTARRSSALAAETRRAEPLLRRLLDTPSAPGVRTGRTRDFEWRLDLARRTDGGRGPEGCTRRVELRSLHTRRVYVGATAEICAAREAGR